VRTISRANNQPQHVEAERSSYSKLIWLKPPIISDKFRCVLENAIVSKLSLSN